MMAAMRAVNTTTDGVNLSTYASTLQQPPFLSPASSTFIPRTIRSQGPS